MEKRLADVSQQTAAADRLLKAAKRCVHMHAMAAEKDVRQSLIDGGGLKQAIAAYEAVLRPLGDR